MTRVDANDGAESEALKARRRIQKKDEMEGREAPAAPANEPAWCGHALHAWRLTYLPVSAISSRGF